MRIETDPIRVEEIYRGGLRKKLRSHARSLRADRLAGRRENTHDRRMVAHLWQFRNGGPA